ncbi:MAG: hypothetical protein Kow0069_35750 [Promethearchaeota archaeon]
MNPLALLDASFLWAYGIVVLYYALRYWRHPHKTLKVRVSELVYSALFFVNGTLVLFLFAGQGLGTAQENLLYLAMFACFAATLSFLWGDVLYTRARVKRNPRLLDPEAWSSGKVPVRDFDEYFQALEAEYEAAGADRKDVKKDLSRKFLHLVILGVVVGFHEMAYWAEGWLADAGLTPLAARNAAYYVAGYFFTFMFATADVVRVYHFPYLPDWALKWYGASVEVKTEKYSYISSVPFLLSITMLVLAPFPVILTAAVVSCISDGAASIVGKNFGRHKLGSFGCHPHKSWEGLFAGASSAFVGVFLVFVFYPQPGVTTAWQLLFGVAAAAAFVYSDCFAKYVVDNVLNTLVPALLVWIPLAFLAA